jgi:hypothetical protein
LKFTSTPVVRVAIPIPKCTKCLALNVSAKNLRISSKPA